MNRTILLSIVITVALSFHLSAQMTIDGGASSKAALVISTGKYNAQLTPGQADFFSFLVREDGKVSLSVQSEGRETIRLQLAMVASGKLRGVAKGEKADNGVKIEKSLKKGNYLAKVYSKKKADYKYTLDLQIAKANPANFEFRFAPIDGVKGTQIYTVEASDPGGTGKSEVFSEFEHKKTKDGFLLDTKVVSKSFTQNGKKRQLPEPEKNVVFTSKFDREGRLLDITGHEEVFKKQEEMLKKQLGEEKTKQIFQRIQLQKRKDIGRWMDLIGGLVGTKGKLGDIEVESVVYPFHPQVQIPICVVTKYSKRVEHEGRNCIQIDIFVHSNIEKLQKQVDVPADRLPKIPVIPGVEMTGHGVKILEPETMNPHLLKTEQKIVATGRQGTVQVVRSEKYAYKYQ